MIRFVLRFLGLLLLALAFIFVVYDGVKSIADSTLYLTRLGQFWTEVHAASLQSLRDAIETRASGVWPLAERFVLAQPAAAVFAVLGVLLILLGRKKRALIGYARD